MVGENVGWDACDGPEASSNNSQNKNENNAKDAKSARRILNEAANGQSANPEAKSGKFITLKKLEDKR